MQNWTKESIQALLDKSDKAVVKALQILLSRQTDSEQRCQETRDRNGRGFTAHDAHILTDIAQRMPRYGNILTPKQLAFCRKRLKKYWRQLLEEIPIERQAMSPKAVAALVSTLTPDSATPVQ